MNCCCFNFYSMQIHLFSFNIKGPAFESEKAEKAVKVLEYLQKSLDTDLIPDSVIQKMEIYDNYFMKFYVNEKEYCIDFEELRWLRTHHFIKKAIRYKEQAELFWDLISPHINHFKVQDWFVVNRNYTLIQIEGITYDTKNIYVNEKNTGLEFTSANYDFVVNNKSRWK